MAPSWRHHTLTYLIPRICQAQYKRSTFSTDVKQSTALPRTIFWQQLRSSTYQNNHLHQSPPRCNHVSPRTPQHNHGHLIGWPLVSRSQINGQITPSLSQQRIQTHQKARHHRISSQGRLQPCPFNVDRGHHRFIHNLSGPQLRTS